MSGPRHLARNISIANRSTIRVHQTKVSPDSRALYSSQAKVLETNQKDEETTKKEEQKPRRTQAEADAALIAAYREKFGGETTATFEDGKPSEMGRAVRNNMFRYI